MSADSIPRRPFRRALVTGGAGFLGSHLCERLLDEGAEVVAVDNFATGTLSNLTHLADHPGLTVIDGDVTEPLAVTGPYDLVAHLAGIASPVDYGRMPIPTLRCGAQGTEHALAIAEREEARFLLASTSEVYGDPERHPQTEDYRGNVDPVGPRSVYDEAKRYAEALTTAYRHDRGVDTAIARIFNTYGPRMRSDDGRMIPTFIRQAMAGSPLTVTGTGTQTRSVCYVSDTVEGLLALAGSESAGPVNIGGTDELTVRRIAEEVLRATGSDSPLEYVAAAPGDPRRRRPDISRAAAELGWKPVIGLDDGLAMTVAWTAGAPTAAGAR